MLKIVLVKQPKVAHNLLPVILHKLSREKRPLVTLHLLYLLPSLAVDKVSAIDTLIGISNLETVSRPMGSIQSVFGNTVGNLTPVAAPHWPNCSRKIIEQTVCLHFMGQINQLALIRNLRTPKRILGIRERVT